MMLVIKKKTDLLSVCLARFTRCFRERRHKFHVVEKKKCMNFEMDEEKVEMV